MDNKSFTILIILLAILVIAVFYGYSRNDSQNLYTNISQKPNRITRAIPGGSAIVMPGQVIVPNGGRYYGGYYYHTHNETPGPRIWYYYSNPGYYQYPNQYPIYYNTPAYPNYIDP